MELSEYLATIRRRAWVIAVLAVLGATGGYGLAASQPDQYRATAKVFVSLEQGETVSELVQGSAYTQSLVESYVQLATMPVVLEPVIDRLGLETTPRALARSVTAEAPLGTVIIEVSAVNTSPAQASDVANAVVDSLGTAVSAVSPTGPGGRDAVQLSTVAQAPVPLQRFAPNTRLGAATGLALGVLLGLAYALLREAMDTRVRAVRDVERITGAAVLGSITTTPRRRRDSIVMLEDPHGPSAESYRRLRTNLQFLGVEGRLRSVVVTSAVAGEGKSTTALNLALAVAEGTGRVLLIDADLRRPAVARYTGLEEAAGLTTVLIGSADVDAVIQPWGSANLDVITAGALPPNPSQLLSSNAMKSLLDSLVDRYDLVVVDCAPVLPVADPAIVSRLTDGALVVAGVRRLRRHQLADALRALESSGGRIHGVVLNRLKRTDGAGAYTYEQRSSPARRRPPRGHDGPAGTDAAAGSSGQPRTTPPAAGPGRQSAGSTSGRSRSRKGAPRVTTRRGTSVP
ncbi:polysaccharide biosynthesis tyrosine autokinase [uncultured Cellulomonas sp.]|uniref:polysaccharide biosynthesis tyrosine autokinase n=1 Tax=uncultured Cellulomonas sp. TaxID=189682 RepID=UPI002602C290|nr:polysaccharide biosynthesis tyrosine autokinase [uncultured Cellulomonas sp.]